MLGISKDSFLVAVDPNQYKESADGSTDLRPGGMESNSSMAPLLWSSPLLDLGRKHYIFPHLRSFINLLNYSLG